MSFKSLNLSSDILRALEALNYQTPTEIQKKSIPVVLKGYDMLAMAQTGTGKTAAFALPILNKFSIQKMEHSNSPRCLVVAPTRELAMQIGASFHNYARYLELKIQVVYGGVKINPQIAQLNRGVDILIATPGRLLDLYAQKAIILRYCNTVVLDEADRMLDMGFIHDIRRIFAKLPTKRQTLMFSATMSKAIRALAQQFTHTPVEVSIAPPNSTVPSIKQIIYPVDQKSKAMLLVSILSHEKSKQALVFTRTKHGANKLVSVLEKEGISALAIHGNKSQAARIKALNAFKSGEIRILVATDLAARGLDIDKLPLAINFELPQVPEDYVHRIGRTGRAGRIGKAISLVCFEEYVKLLAIEKLIKRVLPRRMIDGFEISTPLPISHLNRKIENVKKKRRPSAQKSAQPKTKKSTVSLGKKKKQERKKGKKTS